MVTENPFLNDFDQSDPDTTRWALTPGREMVEQRRYSMRVFDLKKHPEWKDRDEVQRPFKLGDVMVKPVKDNVHLEWYLELVDPGPQCIDTAINLIQTRCRYGNYRYWFECPGCNKRVGVLYRDKDQFRCRKCLKLVYQLQTMNYKGMEVFLIHKNKWEEMSNNKRRFFYAGKDTKWFRKYKELAWRNKGGVFEFNKKLKKLESKKL